VGSSIHLANATVEYGSTIAVAGTPEGFVAAFSEQSATLLTFIPTSSSGIVSDGGALPTMTLMGGPTNGAGLLAVGDDVGTGGANGVGVALDYNAGLSFAYLSADGSQVLGPIPVLPAQIAASGCH
jgi:hypothetical protein